MRWWMLGLILLIVAGWRIRWMPCVRTSTRGPTSIGGRVDRSDGELHSDVWHVMESIWAVQQILKEQG